MRSACRSVPQVLVALILSAVSVTPAQAAPILVTSRAALGGTDFVNWAPVDTTPSNPFNINSNLGVSVAVSKTLSGTFGILQQGTTFGGNFAPGDGVLYTNNFGSNASNAISIANFPTGVSAAGAQIQPNSFGAFVARITAFDAANNQIASFTENGNSSSGNDNTAIFIGITSDVPIFRVAFSIDSAPGPIGDFAINRFDFTAIPPPPDPVVGVVPEPATLGVFGLMALGGLVARRRAKSAA